MCTPFQWTKKVASHLGGTRNPMVITWPNRITGRGQLRSQFGHVNDIMPTVLEAAAIAAPELVDGTPQRRLDGTSLVYSFANAKAPERHRSQYFELLGHRAIYHEGWMASAFHTALPWRGYRPDHPFSADKWELYDLGRDFSQAHDLAGSEPARLEEMKRLFDTEAVANQVYPLSAALAGGGVPNLLGNRQHLILAGGMNFPEAQLRELFNRSWSISADISVTTGGSRGVIAAMGSNHAGWSLYLDASGRPTFEYRSFAVDRTKIAAAEPLPVGDHRVELEFAYAGGGAGKGAATRLVIDGVAMAQGRIKATPSILFTTGETLDTGIDTGAPSGDYPVGSMPGYALSGGSIRKLDLRLE